MFIFREIVWDGEDFLLAAFSSKKKKLAVCFLLPNSAIV